MGWRQAQHNHVSDWSSANRVERLGAVKPYLRVHQPAVHQLHAQQVKDGDLVRELECINARETHVDVHAGRLLTETRGVTASAECCVCHAVHGKSTAASS